MMSGLLGIRELQWFTTAVSDNRTTQKQRKIIAGIDEVIEHVP